MPPTDIDRHCFTEPFSEGSSSTPSDLTSTARVLDAIMRRTLFFKDGVSQGLDSHTVVATELSDAADSV